jgi:hypothetical protein
VRRRRVLAALGTAAAGGSAVLGTGAFTSVEADRSVEVEVANDADALLAIVPSDEPNGAFVTGADAGAARLDLSPSNDAVPGEGVNDDAVTELDDVFRLVNRGTRPVGVWIAAATGSTVDFYRRDDPDATLVGEDNAVCLGVGESVRVGVRVDTRETSTTDLLDTMTVHGDAGVGCGVPAGGGGASGPRRLDTGEAGWQVTKLPPEVSGPSPPYPAQVVTPPSAWATVAEAEWVDPFGTGGLGSDTADDAEPYVYELTVDVPADETDLVIEAYGADNPVTLLLDGDEVASREEEAAYAPLESTTIESLAAGSHTLRAEVTNLEGANRNPTGLLVAARLEVP